MKIIDIINNRHSYRGKYKPISVPREDLITIMQAGLNAPSGCNKQTTSLIAVDDKDILQKLHNVINPPVGETAPAIICVLTQRINAYRDKCFAVQDYSAAIENMLLALVQFFGVAVENLPRWAAGKDTAMITVILFSVWKNMGYTLMNLVQAALSPSW